MIRIKASGFPQFLAVHATLRGAGVEAVASGGNELRVPDDTPVEVLRAVAGTGAAVFADLTSPADGRPGEDVRAAEDAPPADKPARKPRKTTTRRTSRE